MITLHQAENLARRIAEIVGQPGREVQAAKLAAEYAEACRAAARRLEQCAAMIEAGQDLPALQLAETPPPLLDLITRLSFRQSAEWRTYCQSHGLPAPEPFFDKHVRLLNDAYAKGLDGDHPYFRGYRQAVMTNDDERALAILRVIARMNAADKNTAQELQRLEEKVLRAKLEGLRAVLESGNPDAVLTRLAEIEASSLAVSTKHPVWQKAQLLRCERLIGEAEALRKQEVWQEVEPVLQEIRRLATQHSVLFPPDDQERFTALEKWTTEWRKAFADEQDFQRALTALDYQVGAIETKSRTGGGTLPECQNDYSALVAKWQEAERFKRPLDEQLTTRCQQSCDWLQGRIQAHLKRKRLKSLATNLAVAAALVIAGWLAWDWYAQRELLRQFATLQSARRVGDLDKLLTETPTRMKAKARVAGAAEEARKFVARERELKQTFDQKLQALEALNAQEPGNVFAQMESRRTECNKALAAVAPEFQTDGKSNLLAFDQRWQTRIAALQPERAARFTQRLLEGERLTATRLNGTNDFAIVRESLTVVGEIVDELSRLQAAPGVLDAALVGRFRSLTNRVTIMVQAAKDWEQLRAATPASLDEYLAWLKRRVQSPFAATAELEAMAELGRLRVSPTSLLGGLLLPGLPQVWDSLTNLTAADPQPKPAQATAAEQTAYLALRNDPNLQDVHLYSLVKNPRPDNPVESHAVLTQGKLIKDRLGKETGKIYDPKKFPDNLRFEQVTIDSWDYKPEYQGLTRECFALERLSLGDLLETNSANCRKSVLELLDRLNQDTETSATFRAFAALKLFAVAEERPGDWGLPWSPGALKFVAGLKQLGAAEIQSGDWMLPRQLRLHETNLQKYFEQTRTLSFRNETRFMHRLMFRAGETGFTFAGFADATGKPTLTQTNALRGEYWGWSRGTKLPALLLRRSADGAPQTLAEPLPFTPLFSFRGDRAQLLENAASATSYPWREAGTPLPPLFDKL